MWLRPRATVSTSSHFSAPRRFYPKKSFLSKRFFVPQMPSLLNTKTYFGSRCTTRTRIVPDFRRSYSLNYSTSSVHQIDPSVHSLQQLTTMGLLEEAESELASIPPSNRTADHYNPIMEYHVRAGNATRARALLKEMKSLKIPPNEARYEANCAKINDRGNADIGEKTESFNRF